MGVVKLDFLGRMDGSPDLQREEKESRHAMTISRRFAGLVTFSLLLAAGAVAGATNKGKLHVAEDVTIGGKQLAAGDYQLEWSGTGSNVELSISSGKETVAKVPAQIVPLKVASIGNAYSTDSAAGGKTLTGIYLSGKKFELSLGEVSAAAPAGATKDQGNN
jgi:hypothetical protein